MKNLIEINGLCKEYSGFSLKNVSFNVPGGSIVGFVGENGAGKTTTIKAILNIIHIDSGTIHIMGQDNITRTPSLHQDIGVVFDECSFHDWLRPSQLADILRPIYRNWDDNYYQQLLGQFNLVSQTNKSATIKTFSRGMKMKLALAVALAHHPKLLVLDEATSGLDPVVRDEILEMFLDFIKDEEHSILFSSHITSDIEKAADYLVFIHQGQVLLDAEKDRLLDQYGVLRCGREQFAKIDTSHVVGTRQTSFGIEALIDNRQDFSAGEGMVVDPAKVDDIILFSIRGKSA